MLYCQQGFAIVQVNCGAFASGFNFVFKLVFTRCLMTLVRSFAFNVVKLLLVSTSITLSPDILLKDR